jgi:cytochrome c
VKRTTAALFLGCALTPSPAAPLPGAALYDRHCAQCHGAQGQGGQGFSRPIWGSRSDLRRFGTAQGLLEYLLLLMPFDDPSRLSEDQKQAIARYLIDRHDGLAPAPAPAPATWNGQAPIR